MNIGCNVWRGRKICNIMCNMIKVIITKNDSNQRLDRFLRKYLKNASISHIYKMIRKDVKLNGKRAKENTVLKEYDELLLYISNDEAEKFKKNPRGYAAVKQFKIAYEDDEVLIVVKPPGLLIHGDKFEKKNTLTNQVISYFIEKGIYDIREKTFVPAPSNRLDRNTGGLVVFGKNAEAVRLFNNLMKDKDKVEKNYITIVRGEIPEQIIIDKSIEKNESENQVKVVDSVNENSKVKPSATVVSPIDCKNGYTLADVRLLTGRTHQIRAHLSSEGYPIIGDHKYGDKKTNEIIKNRYGLTSQFLFAYKLFFHEGKPAGKEIHATLPEKFKTIKNDIFKNKN